LRSRTASRGGTSCPRGEGPPERHKTSPPTAHKHPRALAVVAHRFEQGGGRAGDGSRDPGRTFAEESGTNEGAAKPRPGAAPPPPSAGAPNRAGRPAPARSVLGDAPKSPAARWWHAESSRSLMAARQR
jgi:hypothetical protein